jgi:hypothetical protein
MGRPLQFVSPVWPDVPANVSRGPGRLRAWPKLLLVSELFPFAVELACLSDVGTGAANGLLAALEMRDSNSDMGKCGLSPMDTGLQSLVEVTGAPSVLFLLAEVAKKTLQVSTFGVSVLAALYLVVRRIFPF